MNHQRGMQMFIFSQTSYLYLLFMKVQHWRLKAYWSAVPPLGGRTAREIGHNVNNRDTVRKTTRRRLSSSHHKNTHIRRSVENQISIFPEAKEKIHPQSHIHNKQALSGMLASGLCQTLELTKPAGDSHFHQASQ